jgi:dTDP-4-dehydrorhamnose reductase
MFFTLDAGDFMKILILGISGMLGSTLFRYFSEFSNYEVVGLMRSESEPLKRKFKFSHKIISGVDAVDLDALEKIFLGTRPDIIINCIGVIKHLESAENSLIVLPINSMLPHRLAKLAELINARLIHFSTDCVFSGNLGGYKENDFADARDLYGRSKFLGEVSYENAITLRTSIIGHEVIRNISLIDWFLSQNQAVRGYKNAIFSGLPTVEVANVILNYVLPNPQFFGLYHLAAKPISKYNLLQMVSNIYAKNIEIISDETVRIDRSLNAEKFNLAFNYVPPEWPDLVKKMYDFR